jgi:hypothetical protein
VPRNQANHRGALSAERGSMQLRPPTLKLTSAKAIRDERTQPILRVCDEVPVHHETGFRARLRDPYPIHPTAPSTAITTLDGSGVEIEKARF